MRFLQIIFATFFVYLGCGDATIDQVSEPGDENKILLLQVDYQTTSFEGGKELDFSPASNFTLGTTYNPPGDFGDITLTYLEVNQPIFEGTIVWAGLGEMSYPNNLLPASSFNRNSQGLPLPSANLFQTVNYEGGYYPDPLDIRRIWDEIADLELVESYRQANPQSQIQLFLYTPSVGVGNPADWDWYVMLKN